jgi:hypothetical protein
MPRGPKKTRPSTKWYHTQNAPGGAPLSTEAIRSILASMNKQADSDTIKLIKYAAMDLGLLERAAIKAHNANRDYIIASDVIGAAYKMDKASAQNLSQARYAFDKSDRGFLKDLNYSTYATSLRNEGNLGNYQRQPKIKYIKSGKKIGKMQREGIPTYEVATENPSSYTVTPTLRTTYAQKPSPGPGGFTVNPTIRTTSAPGAFTVNPTIRSTLAPVGYGEEPFEPPNY